MDGNILMPPPLTGASNAGEVFSTNMSFYRVLSTLRPSGVINTVPPYRGKLVTLIAGSSKRRSLLMSVDGRRSGYDNKCQRYVEENRTAFNCMQW